jgi:hypothetical protein
MAILPSAAILPACMFFFLCVCVHMYVYSESTGMPAWPRCEFASLCLCMCVCMYVVRARGWMSVVAYICTYSRRDSDSVIHRMYRAIHTYRHVYICMHTCIYMKSEFSFGFLCLSVFFCAGHVCRHRVDERVHVHILMCMCTFLCSHVCTFVCACAHSHVQNACLVYICRFCVCMWEVSTNMVGVCVHVYVYTHTYAYIYLVLCMRYVCMGTCARRHANALVHACVNLQHLHISRCDCWQMYI